MGSIEQDYESLAVAQAPKDEVYRFEISHKTVTRTSLILTLLLVAAMGTVAVVDKVHGSSKIGAQDMTSASSAGGSLESVQHDDSVCPSNFKKFQKMPQMFVCKEDSMQIQSLSSYHLYAQKMDCVDELAALACLDECKSM